MDEETKKTIAALCSSVDAMEAEIVTLKKVATNSGINPAGSQDSDIVSGTNPPNKRRRTTFKDASDIEEEEPLLGLVSRGQTLFFPADRAPGALKKGSGTTTV